MHRARPEWGVGSITEAQKSVHEGVVCQRLTVRFENGGIKTVSTAFAELSRVEAGSVAPRFEPDRSTGISRRNGGLGGGLPVAIDVPDPDLTEFRERLASLPDAAADPFRPLASRLRATLELYRYTNQGGSLLAWATAVAGLADPLSCVSRHELEQAFERFELQRDRHLSQLMQLAPREGMDINALTRAMPPEAQRALQRVNRRR